MPRQNTSPSDFPAAIRQQIAQLAQRITAERKRRGATQVQWAEQLGISQPTMARLERGDPAVSMATYVACLTLIHPALDLTALLPSLDSERTETTDSIASNACLSGATGPKHAPSLAPAAPQEAAQVAQQFAKAKAALDGFKSLGM